MPLIQRRNNVVREVDIKVRTWHIPDVAVVVVDGRDVVGLSVA